MFLGKTLLPSTVKGELLGKPDKNARVSLQIQGGVAILLYS